MKAPLTYTLRQPITRLTRTTDGIEHEEELRPAGATIVLRRPKAKDLMLSDRYPGRPVELSMVLIERISNLDADAVAEMDAEDLAALGELVAAFTPNGPKTGETA